MKERTRHWIQAVSALLMNGNLKGFAEGRIWQGQSKRICVPGLNCYSCPGAFGACPIGSLQAVLNGRQKSLSFYVTGLLILFGTIFGRLICGFLCPFGFLQELLYRIPVRKWQIPAGIDGMLRYLKYVILVVFVLLLPALVHGTYGIGDPWFCKYICPAGTLEGGIPLVLTNPALRSMVGFLFSWKMLILILTVTASMHIYRPFCKYICPLGAVYALFNRFSIYRMQVEEDKCTHCGICEKTCLMQVKVTENINSPECIRCGACKNVCPVHAISSGYRWK
ncbi:MAG: 4Fe-4S binding protein [Butyrivibrio sp.]|nr:4Fe-4S binding protein [Butyrivibrio sp.]